MGAILSLPLLAVPSMGTVLGCMASCCGAATCSAVCSACGKCGNSIATRLAYALILLTNSILSWIMLTPWAIKKLQHLTLDYMEISCPDGPCYGWVAVHRINFALGVFHLIMGAILFGVDSTKNPRAKIQNGFWGLKILAWLVLIVLTFMIPESFFFTWGNYISLAGATVFLLLGLILLVDLAHSWAEYCLSKIDDETSLWKYVLVGSTIGMYIVSIVSTVIMYIFFASSGCTMNQVAITVNTILFLVTSVVSVYSKVQECNPRAGLAQAAVVAVYCTYLTMSAVSMEPDDKHCNPFVRAQGTRTTSVVVGAIVTMLTVAYTTTSTATRAMTLGNSGVIRLPEEEGDNLITKQPDTYQQMRIAALRQAVAEGSLPDHDFHEDDSDNDSGINTPRDDERARTKYNYTFFHIIFFIATMWVASLLTMNVEESTKNGDDFAPVGRTYWASWVKIISAWVCYAIYTWSLIAPIILPERFAFD